MGGVGAFSWKNMDAPKIMKKPELHLFIIWNKGLQYSEEVLRDLRQRFFVLKTIRVFWSDDSFDNNLRRFYGKNLPKNSNKIKLCGKGPFLAIIVKDTNALYSWRRTTSGVKYVNINTIDYKDYFRNRTKGNILHCTNTIGEVKHDLSMLFGLSEINEEMVLNIPDLYYGDLVGEHGWSDIRTLFSTLNNTISYIPVFDSTTIIINAESLTFQGFRRYLCVF